MQIENEYNNVQEAYRESGHKYVKWAAELAVNLHNGIPWLMCKQRDAPDTVVSTGDFRTGRPVYPCLINSLCYKLIYLRISSRLIINVDPFFFLRLVHVMEDNVETLSLVPTALTSLPFGPRTGQLSKSKFRFIVIG